MRPAPVEADRPDRDAAVPADQRAALDLRSVGIIGGWVLLVAALVVQIATILVANHTWLVHQMPDDAYYYLEIGQRLADGQGFTFDGINQTDGFHPLWQLLVGALALVFRGDDLVRASLVVAVLMSYAAVVLLMRLLRPVVGSGAVLAGGLLAVHGVPFHGTLVSGMEGPAVVLALALLLTAFAWCDRRGWRTGDTAVLGMTSGLLVLARLDLVVVLAFVPVLVFWRSRNARVLLSWAGATLALAGAWMVWHQIEYGHVATVSAVVKQQGVGGAIDAEFGGRATPGYVGYAFSLASDYARWLFYGASSPALPVGAMLRALARLVVLTTATVGAVALWRGRADGDVAPPEDRRRSAARAAALLGGVMVVAKGLFDIVFSPTGAMTWYSAPQVIAVPFVVGLLVWIGVEAIYRTTAVAAVAVAAVFAFVAMPYSLEQITNARSEERREAYWQDELDRAADWIGAAGPSGRYGAFDAGLLGFELHDVSGVVNLDGRVNDHEHAELVTSGASDLELVAAADVDVLVNRLRADRLAELSCGNVLWQSDDVLIDTVLRPDEITAAPVSVIDVRPCFAPDAGEPVAG